MSGSNLKNENDVEKSFIDVLAGLSITVLLVGFLLAKSGWISPGAVACLIALAGILGSLILIESIEGVLRIHMVRFYGLRYACLAVFTLGAYVARVNGLNDINSVFHIDPGALPLTAWVATALHMLKLLQPFFIGGLASAIYLAFDRAKGWSGIYEDKDWIHWTVCSVALGLFVIIGLARTGTDARAQFLYRVSQDTDFVSKFACQGIEATGVVGLFIGPDQRRVLLAPEIHDSEFFDREVPRLFKPVKIPKEFPILDCVAPPVDMRQWRRENLNTD